MQIYATKNNLPIFAFQWNGDPKAFKQNKVRLFTHQSIHTVSMGMFGINVPYVYGYYFNPKTRKLYFDNDNQDPAGTSVKTSKLDEIYVGNWVVYDSSRHTSTKPFYTNQQFHRLFKLYTRPKKFNTIYVISSTSGAYSDAETRILGYVNTEAKAMAVVREKDYADEPSAEGIVVDNYLMLSTAYNYEKITPIK